MSGKRRDQIGKKEKRRSRLIGREHVHGNWKAHKIGKLRNCSRKKENRRMSGKRRKD
jgi:hypothetical protein